MIASTVVGGYLLFYTANLVIGAIGSAPAPREADQPRFDPPAVVKPEDVQIPVLNVDNYCRMQASALETGGHVDGAKKDPSVAYENCFNEQQRYYDDVKIRWPKVSPDFRSLCVDVAFKGVGLDALLSMGSLYHELDTCLAERQAETEAADKRLRLMESLPHRQLQR